MARLVFVCMALVGLIYKAECAAPSGWTTPVVTGADGSAPLLTTVAENTVGALAITIAASGATHFAIIGQEVAGKFSIGETTGFLSLATGTLDFETKPTYILTITGSDGSSPSGTITTTLSITDVNEAPTFAPATYNVAAVSGSTAGTTITTVTATDQDAGDVITYAIESGNTNSDMQISSTGIITVAAGKTLNRAATSFYTLTVTATDDDASPLTGTTTVSINFNSAVGVSVSGLLAVLALMLLYIM